MTGPPESSRGGGTGTGTGSGSTRVAGAATAAAAAAVVAVAAVAGGGRVAALVLGLFGMWLISVGFLSHDKGVQIRGL